MESMEISKGKVDASFWKGKKVFLLVIQVLKVLVVFMASNYGSIS